MKNNELLDKKLNEESISKESLKLLIQSNSSLIPFTIGLSASMLTYFAEFVTLSFVSLGLAGAGICIFLLNLFFRKDTFKQEFMKSYNVMMAKKIKEKRKFLENKIESIEAIKQVSFFETKFEFFKKTLNESISNTSYAYHRIVGAMEEVYLKGINNLEFISKYEDNIKMISEEKVLLTIQYIENKKEKNEYDFKNLEELNKSLEKIKDYRIKIAEIINQNHIALSKMDDMQLSLTNLNKPEDMEVALEEISVLSEVLSYKDDQGISFT